MPSDSSGEPAAPQRLDEAYRRGNRSVARTAEGAVASPSPHGEKYSLVGLIVTPDGRQVLIQTVWIIEPGDDRPRFVTAYPA